MTIIEWIGTHPKVAFLFTLFMGLIAHALKEAQIPVIVMQGFQIFAWTVTSVVGLITIISWCHRVYKKYIKKEKP